jgi:hypothetical protein
MWAIDVMCIADLRHEVVADIEALPSRLPALCRKLTEQELPRADQRISRSSSESWARSVGWRP